MKKTKNITAIVEDEFHKRGYDVIGMEELNSVLASFGLSAEELTNPEVLKKAAQKLKAEAVIRGEVKTYEVEEIDEYFPVATPDIIIDAGGKI